MMCLNVRSVCSNPCTQVRKIDRTRAKAEFIRLAISIAWLLCTALAMALVQIDGDSLQAENMSIRIESGTESNITPIVDRVFAGLPKIPDGSFFNPDIALHSFMIISLVAAFINWPLLTAIARFRRFLWLFGLGYFLRMLCLAGTIMPPSNPTCIPIERSLIESILMTPALLFGFIHTCTDKIFSGHTIVATLILCSWIDARIEASDAWYSVWFIYPVLHFLFMVTTSIMGWNHYTVDIVVSIIVNVLTFSLYKCLLYVYVSRQEITQSIPLLFRIVGWLDGADLLGKENSIVTVLQAAESTPTEETALQMEESKSDNIV